MKGVAEMGVDNARASLGLQAVLIRFGDQPAKSLGDGAIAGAEPVANERPPGIVIGHQRVHLQGVNVLKDQIPHVLDPAPAQISPELRAPGARSFVWRTRPCLAVTPVEPAER